MTSEFEAWFEQLQSPQAHRALDAGFRASPEEIGKAAVAAVRGDSSAQ
jgi:hypothetical protein